MFKLPDISFPPRILAFLLALILIGGAGWLSYRYIFGTVTFSSEQPAVTVTLTDQINDQSDADLFLPTTYRLRPGRYHFTLQGEGRQDKKIVVTVWPFRHATVNVSLDSTVDITKLPLANKLPYATDIFKISYPDQSSNYTITLYPVINTSGDVANYQSQLNDQGQAALDWIKKQGVDPSKLKIVWSPEKPSNINVGTTAPQ